MHIVVTIIIATQNDPKMTFTHWDCIIHSQLHQPGAGISNENYADTIHAHYNRNYIINIQLTITVLILCQLILCLRYNSQAVTILTHYIVSLMQK